MRQEGPKRVQLLTLLAQESQLPQRRGLPTARYCNFAPLISTRRPSRTYLPSRIASTEMVSRTSSLTIDRYLDMPKSERFSVPVRSPPHTKCLTTRTLTSWHTNRSAVRRTGCVTPLTVSSPSNAVGTPSVNCAALPVNVAVLTFATSKKLSPMRIPSSCLTPVSTLRASISTVTFASCLAASTVALPFVTLKRPRTEETPV